MFWNGTRLIQELLRSILTQKIVLIGIRAGLLIAMMLNIFHGRVKLLLRRRGIHGNLLLKFGFKSQMVVATYDHMLVDAHFIIIIKI